MQTIRLFFALVLFVSAQTTFFAQSIAPPNPADKAPMALRQLALLDAVSFMEPVDSGEISLYWDSFHAKTMSKGYSPNGDTLFVDLATTPGFDDGPRVSFRFWMDDSTTVKGNFAVLHQPYEPYESETIAAQWAQNHIIVPWPTLPATWKGYSPSIPGTYWEGTDSGRPALVYPEAAENIQISLFKFNSGIGNRP